MTARWSAMLVISALVAAVGCYNPDIAQGGLRCAQPGNVCPENFKCASNGRCYRGDAGLAMDTRPACTSVTPDASTCSRPAASGQQCNPACESGCSCGWCAVVNGTATCVTGTPGTKKIGDLCDASKTTDCAPGLFCRADCPGAGRCYKHCEGNDDCAQGSTCSVSGGSGLLCSLPATSCDPIAKTGCPSGFGCYVTGSTAYCDCAGKASGGSSCRLTHDCTPGYGCVGVGQVTPDAGAPTCQQVCQSSNQCGSGVCTTFGATYGYCL